MHMNDLVDREAELNKFIDKVGKDLFKVVTNIPTLKQDENGHDHFVVNGIKVFPEDIHRLTDRTNRNYQVGTIELPVEMFPELKEEPTEFSITVLSMDPSIKQSTFSLSQATLDLVNSFSPVRIEPQTTFPNIYKGEVSEKILQSISDLLTGAEISRFISDKQAERLELKAKRSKCSEIFNRLSPRYRVEAEMFSGYCSVAGITLQPGPNNVASKALSIKGGITQIKDITYFAGTVVNFILNNYSALGNDLPQFLREVHSAYQLTKLNFGFDFYVDQTEPKIFRVITKEPNPTVTFTWKQNVTGYHIFRRKES